MQSTGLKDKNGSRLSWASGLKWNNGSFTAAEKNVSPFMGEWIEIINKTTADEFVDVSPFMGEWIEILKF